MRIVCASPSDLASIPAPDLAIPLYEPGQSSIGVRIPDVMRRHRMEPSARAWDLLSIALAVVATDLRVPRNNSPDGWTRTLDLQVSVSDPTFWSSQSALIAEQLRFVTTDIWSVAFLQGELPSTGITQSRWPKHDSIVLLSGGLDSLVGAIDIVCQVGKHPYAVSQISQGDKQTQRQFASAIGGGLSHIQLNHGANYRTQSEPSQRARSIIFLSYGVLVASTLARYREGDEVTLYIAENGFVSLNPPLTGSRLGSLSTRTTHPFFLRLFQLLLNAAGIHVRLTNPYQFMTKGEMLRSCKNRDLLAKNASVSNSCGRFARHVYRHCGRCVPCVIRRAAFRAWDVADDTEYVYADLSLNDAAHARHDDVRSLGLAVATAEAEGVSRWARHALNTALIDDVSKYSDLATRGIAELGEFLRAERVL